MIVMRRPRSGRGITRSCRSPTSRRPGLSRAATTTRSRWSSARRRASLRGAPQERLPPPVVRRWNGPLLVAEHHLPEDLHGEWTHEDLQLVPLREFLREQVSERWLRAGADLMSEGQARTKRTARTAGHQRRSVSLQSLRSFRSLRCSGGSESWRLRSRRGGSGTQPRGLCRPSGRCAR